MEVDFIRYKIQGLKDKKKLPNPTVNQPTSVFDRSSKNSKKNLIDFEEHIINYASEAIKKASNKRKIINVEVPVKGKNGKWTKLKVQVAVEENKINQSKFGMIKSWWIPEENKLNSDL